MITKLIKKNISEDANIHDHDAERLVHMITKANENTGQLMREISKNECNGIVFVY